MPDSYFLAALRALRESHVEFVVVGGVAAVLNGAPINTFDLDIVASRRPENVTKLVDVLGTIGHGLGYEELLPHTEEMEIGVGVRVRVLNLAKIVALKEELGGEKDLAVLPILRRTLEERQRGGG